MTPHDPVADTSARQPEPRETVKSSSPIDPDTLLAIAREPEIEPPTPLGALKFRMEQGGHTLADLAKLIGSRPRASEILAGKRELSKAQIALLVDHWGMDARVLIGSPGPEWKHRALTAEARLQDETARADEAEKRATNFELGAPALVMVLHGAIRRFLDEQHQWFEAHGWPVKYGVSYGAMNDLQRVWDDTNIQATMWGEYAPFGAFARLQASEARNAELEGALREAVDELENIGDGSCGYNCEAERSIDNTALIARARLALTQHRSEEGLGTSSVTRPQSAQEPPELPASSDLEGGK